MIKLFDQNRRRKLVRLLYSFILSLICFSVILPKIKLDIYNLIYACILLLTIVVLDKKKNAKHIFQASCFGMVITVGYMVSKMLREKCDIKIFFSGEIYRWVIISTIMVEYAYIMFCYKRYSIASPDVAAMELFPEREEDIKRLEEYIQKYDVIGINGGWGSGKTHLVNEFISRKQKEYEVIKIETLTCKFDNIDLYIIRQMEKILWRNGIYPRYSRQIQYILGDNRISKLVSDVFVKGSQDNSTAFNGFCEDIGQITKPILLVCEDIDRISENYVDEVAKVLDITAKLKGNKVKIIYEYDQEKMSALGFNREYMEKYVPYMINLTDIPFMRLIKMALAEEERLYGGLNQDDFRFLTFPINEDAFLKKMFGIYFTLTIRLNRITPRSVKEFVAEVNLAMKNEVFVIKENRKVVIAFFYLKIFMWQLYEKLPFEDDIQNEIRFQRNIANENTVHSYYFSITELVNMFENSQMNANDLKQMFSPNVNEIEEPYIAENREKLVLLHLLGFDFSELQKWYEIQHRENAVKTHNPILDEELSTIKSIEHNIKINRLVKNLHMNGKSEYTNNEANARHFIDKVLLVKKEEQENAWHEYINLCYNGELYKDNNTIFMFQGDNVLSLAKAIRTVIESPKYVKERGVIKERFLDFWAGYNDDNKIILETVKVFRFIEPDDQKSFIKAVKYFNTLQITGNMNGEDVYIDFIDTYINIAYRLGYIYGSFVHYLIKQIYSKKVEELGKILSQIQKLLQKEIEEQLYPEETRDEFEVVNVFLKKNIEIVENKKVADQRQLESSITINECRLYKNEKVYNELANTPEDVSLQTFRDMLDKKYKKGDITLREYRKLLEMRN